MNADFENPQTPCWIARRFRSSCSGLWYENPYAAGDINAVELNGQFLYRTEDESSLNWIKRVSAWASEIHKESK